MLFVNTFSHRKSKKLIFFTAYRNADKGEFQYIVI
jgi:hypothetical protein